MSSEKIVSTTFEGSHPMTRLEQERDVGRVFAKAYEQETGTKVEEFSQNDVGSRDSKPDFLFECGALQYAVELFEVYQLYSERALARELTNAIYAEIEKRNLGDHYVGIAIDSPILIKHGWDEEVEHQWKARGITKRKGIQKCAREAVDLLVNTVASTKDIPHITKAKHLEVNPEKYPGLAIVSRYLRIGQCSPTDVQRSDNRAAPSISIGLKYNFYPEEIRAKLACKIAVKVARRRKWPPVDRAILVVHDLPRSNLLVLDVPNWVDILKTEVNLDRDISIGFDEVWGVSYQVDGMPLGRGSAQRLC